MKSPSRDDSMFKGAKAETFSKASNLRQNMTKAETKLWSHLRTKEKLGYRFRRQHPCGFYILDFYNHQLKLCVEVDGEYHQNKSQKKKDKERDEYLKYNGIKTIRFTNKQIINEIDFVLEKLREEIEKLKIN